MDGHTARLTMLTCLLFCFDMHQCHAGVSKSLVPFDISRERFSREIQFEMKGAVHIKNTRGATGLAFKVREGHLIPFEFTCLRPRHSPVLSWVFLFCFHSENDPPPKQVTVFSDLQLNKVLGKKEGVQGAVVLVFTRSRFLESVCVTQCVCIRVCDVMRSDMRAVLQKG